MNNPENMAPSEIVSEISSIHSDLKGKLDRIQVLSQTLYRRVRRAKPDDNTSIYIQYANAWIRFSGMANQGALRTVHASKVLKRLAPDASAEESEKPKKEPEPKEVSPVESLMDLYSDEGLDVSVQAPAVPSDDEESEFDADLEDGVDYEDSEEEG